MLKLVIKLTKENPAFEFLGTVKKFRLEGIDTSKAPPNDFQESGFGPVSAPENGAISGVFANLTVKNREIFEKPCFLTKNERG